MIRTGKYRSTKTVIDGITFDSKSEASRYSELKILERAGKIRDLVCQYRIELLPSTRLDDGSLQRAIVYVADFCYLERVTPTHWVNMIEDRKGFRTKDYLLKKKMLLYKIAKGEIVGKFIETKA